MAKIGYVTRIKTKGYEYFYLRKSVRSADSVNKVQLYSFGSRDKALKNLYAWKKNIDSMPQELKDLKFDSNDILSWIEQIENK